MRGRESGTRQGGSIKEAALSFVLCLESRGYWWVVPSVKSITENLPEGVFAWQGVMIVRSAANVVLIADLEAVELMLQPPICPAPGMQVSCSLPALARRLNRYLDQRRSLSVLAHERHGPGTE